MSQSKAKLTAQFFYKQFWASVQSEEKQATLDVFLFLQLSAENLLSAFWVNLQSCLVWCVKRLCDYLLYLWSYVKMLEKANKAKLESTTTPKYSEYEFCMVSLNMVKYGKVIVR